MKKAVLMCVALLVAGCEIAGERKAGDVFMDISVVEVDNCEYVVARYVTYGVSIVHKANCKNPDHRP